MIAERQSGLVGKRGVGPDSETEDDHVGGYGPLAGHDRPNLALAIDVNAGDGGVGADVDADLFHRLVHQLAHVGIQRAHRLRGSVDDGHRDASTGQRLRHLHADVAAADHDGVPRPKPFQANEKRGPIVESLHAENAPGVAAGHGRADRDGPGRQDQMVEPLLVTSPGVQVTKRHVSRLQHRSPRRW